MEAQTPARPRRSDHLNFLEIACLLASEQSAALIVPAMLLRARKWRVTAWFERVGKNAKIEEFH